MVNVPGRSKGCATCRRRKVKCDLLLPECQRCLSLNLRCPGPRTGVIFVHTVPGHHRSQSLSKTKVTSVAQDNAVIARRDGNNTGQALQVQRLPRTQPSRASAFDQLFVSHFIESFGIVKPASGLRVPSTSWVDELPSFVASALPSPAKNAIRAASMISYGTLSRDNVILTESHKWYARALHDLQRFLSRDTITVTESAVCAVVMLIHFETWAGTRPKAWLSHTKGAAKMIETMGPASCRDGFMHRLFSHVRLQTFIISMSENSLHAFASHEWMTKPYEIMPKMMFDHVVDLLFSVQKCLVVAHRLISKPTGKPARDLETMLSMLIEDAASHARFWASQYMPGVFHNNIKGDNSAMLATGGADRVPNRPFRNFPTAVLLSHYNAANLINLRLSSLIPKYPCHSHSHSHSDAGAGVDTDSDLAFQKVETMRDHAQSVLSAFAFINAINAKSGPGPDRGSIMMALQLKFVSLWSPFLYQRQEASSLLRSDKVQKGGFASMAADTNDYFSDVAAFVLREYPLE